MVVTWDSVNKGTNAVLSNNNLTVVIPNNTNVARATEGKTSGKWYWEIKFEALNNAMTGIVRENTSLNSIAYNTSGVAFYYTGGNKYPGASAYGQAYNISNIISVLLDMDLGTIEFWRDGISQGVAFSDLKNNTSPVYPAITSGSGTTGSTSTARFNINEFTYQPPEGYLAYDGSKLVDNKILLLSNDGRVNSIEKGKIKTVNAIPIMTSNTSPSGTAIANAEYSATYQAWKAFNGIKNNGSDRWVTQVGLNYGWLQYVFGFDIIIGAYAITGIASTSTGQSPKTWTFEGSNDGINYTILDIRVNETSWSNGETRTYYMDNTTPYKMYRVNVSSSNNADGLSISELEMFESFPSKFKQLPSYSEQNIIKYGIDSPIKVDGNFTDKNYILTENDSKNTEGLWTTQLNRKPLSIKFN